MANRWWSGPNPWPKILGLSMRPARYPRAPRQNKNAPTPSTRLLPRYQLKTPCAPPPIAPRLVIPGVLARVLVLARPSAREDGTLQNQDEPERPRETQREISGGTHGNAGTARLPQCRTTGLMRSE